MPAILFALASLLGWGIGDIFGTISSRAIGGLQTAIWSFILRLLLFSPLTFFYLENLSSLTPNIFILNIFLGTILISGVIFFFKGLQIGNAPLVGTISASYVSLTVILSIIVFNESISSFQLLAIFLVFIGIALSTFDLKKIKSGKLSLDRSILFALGTFFCWGLYFAFIKIPVNQLGWFWPTFITFSISLIFLLFTKTKQVKLNLSRVFTPILLCALLLGIGDFAFNLGANTGKIAIVASISGSYPIIFVILAFIFFKDKITRQQIFGIVVTLIGIVLLSILSY